MNSKKSIHLYIICIFILWNFKRIYLSFFCSWITRRIKSAANCLSFITAL